MPRPALEVEGARQLRASLKRAGVQLADLKAAHAEVARMVEARARPSTPARTGRLAGSLRSAGTNRAALVRAGRATVPYAGVIHFGWEGHNITAQPWIFDAAQASQAAWERTYLQAIEHIIDSIEGTRTP